MKDIGLVLNEGQILFIVAATIAITKALSKKIKIDNSFQKFLISIGVSLWLIFAVILRDNYIISFINTLLIIILSANGIYDFIPNDNSNELGEVILPEFKSVDVTNEIE